MPWPCPPLWNFLSAFLTPRRMLTLFIPGATLVNIKASILLSSHLTKIYVTRIVHCSPLVLIKCFTPAGHNFPALVLWSFIYKPQEPLCLIDYSLNMPFLFQGFVHICIRMCSCTPFRIAPICMHYFSTFLLPKCFTPHCFQFYFTCRFCPCFIAIYCCLPRCPSLFQALLSSSKLEINHVIY